MRVLIIGGVMALSGCAATSWVDADPGAFVEVCEADTVRTQYGDQSLTTYKGQRFGIDKVRPDRKLGYFSPGGTSVFAVEIDTGHLSPDLPMSPVTLKPGKLRFGYKGCK